MIFAIEIFVEVNVFLFRELQIRVGKPIQFLLVVLEEPACLLQHEAFKPDTFTGSFILVFKP